MIKAKKNNYKHAIEVGMSFGLTSGVITTTGLMVGVYAGTTSQTAVVASVLTIALADAMSDALGIHIAEESENIHSAAEIWVATLTTFLAKLCIAGSFLVALLLFDLRTGVVVNIVYGIVLMTVYNFLIGRKQKIQTWRVVAEHLLIAVLVVVLAYLIGNWIQRNF